MQTDLFTEAERAIHNSLATADREWVMMATSAIERLINRGEEFTSDDVMAMVRATGAETKDTRALGGLIRSYAKEGKIINTERVKRSTDKTCHGRPKTIWQPTVKLPRNGWRRQYAS